MQNEFLIYGANGYTGQLISKLAATYDLRPILAGRSISSVKSLAEQLNLPWKTIDLNNADELNKELSGIKLVLHCAGPFSATAKQMITACLQSGTHYIDINGDIEVFEMLKNYDIRAKEKGIMIMPGVGFDVVPTDCIALGLKNKLPDAINLTLAFASVGGGLSRGTSLTMASRMGEGGAARINGKIVKVPLGQKGMWINFGEKKLFVMSIPWGDISTAYFTTGIPNIETYTGISKKVYRALKFQWAYNWLLRTSLLRDWIQKKIRTGPAGPSDEQRKQSRSFVWGEATNAQGKKVQSAISCYDGYTLTSHSSLIIAKKILSGNYKPGYQTPAACYGENLIMEIPGTNRI